MHGYKASAILTPKNKRLSYSYQIDIIDNTCIVCTVRHIETDTLFAVVKLSNYTTESIEVEHGELYKNCSAYPYRREYNNKYLKKYDQIACIVHGAIAAGLLFDTAEATTAEETNTTGQNTACTDTEPQRATEDAQTESRHKYGMRLRGYSIGAQPAGVVERADDPTGLYYDIITYNRELTPEELDIYSLTPLNAPTSTENAPQEPETNKAGETTTGAEKDAQRATQKAANLANTPEAWEEIPERTETAAPAYIVQCRSKRRPWTDYSSPATLEECEQIKERAEARHVLNQNGEPIMYRIATTPSTTGEHTTQTAHSAPEQTETTEAEHVPTATKTEPPRATDASTTGRADRTTGADTTPPRHTCENATGRTERAQPVQTATTATKSPPRGTRSAADHRQRGSPDRRKGTFSGRISKTGLKIRIIKGTPIFDGNFQKNC